MLFCCYSTTLHSHKVNNLVSTCDQHVYFLAAARSCWGKTFASMAYPFFILGLLYTASTLYIERQVLDFDKQGLTFHQKLRAIYRVWSNARGIPLHYTTTSQRQRVLFSLRKGATAAVVGFAYFLFLDVQAQIYKLLYVMIYFGQAAQILFPSTKRDLIIRLVLSTQWVLHSFALLLVMHSIFAIFFVSIVNWDCPDEWPAVFGDQRQACSLRLFWGAFWHRLHTRSFAAYCPFLRLRMFSGLVYENPASQDNHDNHGNYDSQGNDGNPGGHGGHGDPDSQHQTRQSGNRGPAANQRQRQPTLTTAGKILRAIWILFMSAVYHATVNWFVFNRTNAMHELRFFMLNFLVCSVETAVGHVGQWGTRKVISPLGRQCARFGGYVWVACVFFYLAPPWQISIIRASLLVVVK